jgi:hypothetical protein
MTKANTGDAITIWGSVESYERGFSVSIDGSEPVSYTSAGRGSSTNTTVLAHAGNLGFGKHTILIRNGPSQSTPALAPSRLEIDYVQVFTKRDSVLDLTSAEGTTNPSWVVIYTLDIITCLTRARLSSDPNRGLIVGSVMAVVGCALLIFCFVLYRKRLEQYKIYKNSSDKSFVDEKGSIRSDSTGSYSISAPPKAVLASADVSPNAPSTNLLRLKLPWKHWFSCLLFFPYSLKLIHIYIIFTHVSIIIYLCRH